MLYHLPNGLDAYFPEDEAFGSDKSRNPADKPHGQVNEVFNARSNYNKYFQLKEGMSVLDLGSFIGIYTLYASHLVGESGLVVAVEPFLPAYRILIKNIVINELENVIPVYGAICPETKWVGIQVNDRNYRANRAVVSDHAYIPGYSFDQLKEIFDTFHKKIDFIKMDIEGGEKELADIMTRDIPITFEHHRGHDPPLGLRVDNLRYVNQECQ